MGIYYKKPDSIKENLEKSDKPDKPSDNSNQAKLSDNSNRAKLPLKKQKIIFQTPKMVVPFDIKEFKN
jgi:hypothetical protein